MATPHSPQRITLPASSQKYLPALEHFLFPLMAFLAANTRFLGTHGFLHPLDAEEVAVYGTELGLHHVRALVGIRRAGALALLGGIAFGAWVIVAVGVGGAALALAPVVWVLRLSRHERVERPG